MKIDSEPMFMCIHFLISSSHYGLLAHKSHGQWSPLLAIIGYCWPLNASSRVWFCNISFIYLGWSYFELNILSYTFIINHRSSFIEFSKIGHFTAFEYSTFFSNQWGSIDLIYQKSKPLHMNLHQYHLWTLWW